MNPSIIYSNITTDQKGTEIDTWAHDSCNHTTELKNTSLNLSYIVSVDKLGRFRSFYKTPRYLKLFL